MRYKDLCENVKSLVDGLKQIKIDVETKPSIIHHQNLMRKVERLEAVEDKNTIMIDKIYNLYYLFTAALTKTMAEEPTVELFAYKSYRDAPIIYVNGKAVNVEGAKSITIFIDGEVRVDLDGFGD